MKEAGKDICEIHWPIMVEVAEGIDVTGMLDLTCHGVWDVRVVCEVG